MVNFASTLIPKYLRRLKSISAWAAYAYLKGVSEADMAKVLEVVLGEGARKLTPSVISDIKSTEEIFASMEKYVKPLAERTSD